MVLVPAWWARWHWPLVRAPMVTRLTCFPMGSAGGVLFVWLPWACGVPGPTLFGHSGCCRNGTWCVFTRCRARIWFGVTHTRCRVVPTRSRVVLLPVGPPPTSVCRTATGPVSLHR